MFRIKWKTKPQSKKTGSSNETTEGTMSENPSPDGSSDRNKSTEDTVSGNPSPDGSSSRGPPDGTVPGNHSPGGSSIAEGTMSGNHLPDGNSFRGPPDGTVQGNHPPDGNSSPEVLPADGIPIQLHVESARMELSGGYGDVALILNGFYGWCRAGPRDQGADATETMRTGKRGARSTTSTCVR